MPETLAGNSADPAAAAPAVPPLSSRSYLNKTPALHRSRKALS
jgi:hypothetical protein